MIPGISVVIPTYNREKFIGEAISSVLEQDYDGNIEIIISDDGSTDETLKIASSFGEKVNVVKKPKNCLTQGVASTRNRGIKACTQEYICFLDSDDFYLPGNLKKLANALTTNTTLGFAFCRMLEVKEENGKNVFKPWTHKFIFKNDIRNPVVSRVKIVHTNSIMFRRNVFSKIGYFNESYSNGEDGDLWMRVSEVFKGAFSDHYGAIYRTHHDIAQLTKNSDDEINKCFVNIYNSAIKRYYNLGLKDRRRLFQLKLWLITCKYSKERKQYYLNLLKLISKYPFDFLQKFTVHLTEYLEKSNTQSWQDLNAYL